MLESRGGAQKEPGFDFGQAIRKKSAPIGGLPVKVLVDVTVVLPQADLFEMINLDFFKVVGNGRIEGTSKKAKVMHETHALDGFVVGFQGAWTKQAGKKDYGRSRVEW